MINIIKSDLYRIFKGKEYIVLFIILVMFAVGVVKFQEKNIIFLN